MEWKPALDEVGRVQPFAHYEAEIIRFALQNCGWCVNRAARALQIGRATLYRKIKEYHIVLPPVSGRAIDRSYRKPPKSKAQKDGPRR